MTNPAETILPKNTLISDKGISSDIIRQEFPDRSVALKRAKSPRFNKLLSSEYNILLILGSGSQVPSAIPRVFEEFVPKDENDCYSFQEECFDDYDTLYVRDDKEPRKHLDALSEQDKVFVLDRVRATLAYANQEGFIHGDVQLSNIMTKKVNDVLKVKVVDWANAERITPNNSLDDVTRLVEITDELFNYALPTSILVCIRRFKGGRVKTPGDFYNQLNVAIQDYFLD